MSCTVPKSCILLLLLALAAAAASGRLVPPAALVLDYHGGRLLSGSSLLVNVIWYGDFTAAHKSVVTDFITSLGSSSGSSSVPSASGFWRIVSRYKDASGAHVAASVKLASQVSLPSSTFGSSLKREQLPTIVSSAIAHLKATAAAPASSLYLLLTAADVKVERFCMNSCGTHSHLPSTSSSSSSQQQPIPYAWVGNSATQCPGMCAWPFAAAAYGPPDFQPLRPPSSDIGADGMVVNVALMLAGAATNPFGDGYFQGAATAPLESGTACQGIFGAGSYPGFPGQLLLDNSSGASYNAVGVKQRRFLLPALWDPSQQACSTSFI